MDGGFAALLLRELLAADARSSRIEPAAVFRRLSFDFPDVSSDEIDALRDWSVAPDGRSRLD